MTKKLFILAASVVILFLVDIFETKATCPEGWGEGTTSMTVKDIYGNDCTVIIHFCARNRQQGGQMYIDVQFDWAEYPNCDAWNIPHNSAFWGKVDEAMWNWIEQYPTNFPPCSTSTYTIVTSTFNHCLKIANIIPPPPASPYSKLLPCSNEGFLCEKVWKVCVVNPGPPTEYYRELVSQTATNQSDCLLWSGWTWNPITYPPNSPWESPCLTPLVCE